MGDNGFLERVDELLLDLQVGEDKVAELVLTSYADQMPVRDFSKET